MDNILVNLSILASLATIHPISYPFNHNVIKTICCWDKTGYGPYIYIDTSLCSRYLCQSDILIIHPKEDILHKYKWRTFMPCFAGNKTEITVKTSHRVFERQHNLIVTELWGVENGRGLSYGVWQTHLWGI